MRDLSPAVSMLWEPDDPRVALTERFGFADPDLVTAWLEQTLHEHWGLTLQSCDQIVVSSWNALAWVTADDKSLIAKWCALPPLFSYLTEIAALTTWLSENGVPTAAPLPSVDGRLQLELTAKDGAEAHVSAEGPERRFSLGVLPVVAGDLLDAGDPAQVHDAGRMLATVHNVLAAYPYQVGADKPGDGQQLLHRDFRSANLLHDGARITAVLDWERVAYGTRVTDLALAAVLLATRYHDWAPANDDVRRSFIDAYCEHSPLTGAERQELGRSIDAVLDDMGWRRTDA